MAPSQLSDKQVTRLHQLFHEAKFRDPGGDHLSPAGRLPLTSQYVVRAALSHCYIATQIPWYTAKGMVKWKPGLSPLST